MFNIKEIGKQTRIYYWVELTVLFITKKKKTTILCLVFYLINFFFLKDLKISIIFRWENQIIKSSAKEIK